LILVHRRQLMDRWRERLSAFLDMPIGSIGQIGGGEIKRTGAIDVAVIQSLQRKSKEISKISSPITATLSQTSAIIYPP
jgi:superfamily II DNA or RNA helicase